MFVRLAAVTVRRMSNAVTNIGRRRGRPPGNGGRVGESKNQSLTRALTLLERLAETPGGMSLTDLSQQVGIPPATAHRLLSTFEELDYVEQELASGTRLYHITRHILGLFQGQPGARAWRRHLSQHAHLPNANGQTIEQALAYLPDHVLDGLKATERRPHDLSL